MKKSRKAAIILIFLVMLELIAGVFDFLFNNSRIIKPIDTATFQFRITDLPLTAATVLLCTYVIFSIFRVIFFACKNATLEKQKRTRTINPNMGWMGVFGFFGFLGIPSYVNSHQVFGFFFFIFFGFFGFFYEGKLSGTLIDERFEEEQKRADLSAYKIGFMLLWAMTWLMGMIGDKINTDVLAIVFMISSSLIIALVLFLKSYLLYRYDCEEAE